MVLLIFICENRWSVCAIGTRQQIGHEDNGTTLSTLSTWTHHGWQQVWYVCRQHPTNSHHQQSASRSSSIRRWSCLHWLSKSEICCSKSFPLPQPTPAVLQCQVAQLGKDCRVTGSLCFGSLFDNMSAFCWVPKWYFPLAELWVQTSR